MKAFLSTTITKEELLKELLWHQEQDNFIKGNYWNNGKGCAVGCSIESAARLKGLNISKSDHSQYPALFNIPEWLALVEDRIFEGVSLERSKTWPVEFIEAINVGSNLNNILPDFLVIVLKSTLESIDQENHKDVADAVRGSIALWQRGDIGSSDWRESAAEAAEAAEAAAWAAAWAAAEKYEYFADELLKLTRNCK